MAADLADAGLSGSVAPGDSLGAAPAGNAWSPSARMRRSRPYFLICLGFSTVLFMIGVIGLIKTSLGSRPHTAMGWVLILSGVGVFGSLILVEAARAQYSDRQVSWGLVPILSVGYLAFVPFLWLALIRRRAQNWMVCAAYLAAALALVYVTVVNFYNSAAWAATYVLMACLALIAAAHTVVAFRPAAGAASWGEARAVNDSGGRQPGNRDDTPADTIHPTE